MAGATERAREGGGGGVGASQMMDGAPAVLAGAKACQRCRPCLALPPGYKLRGKSDVSLYKVKMFSLPIFYCDI